MEGGEAYHIGGHKVLFPFKAYPTQLDMMSKIIRGLDKRQNCLLESPTGSGKTLSLLCSSLAWQQTEKAKLDMEMNEMKKDGPCEACLETESELINHNNNSDSCCKDEQNKSVCRVQEVTNNDASYEKSSTVPVHQRDVINVDDDDDDFVDMDQQFQSRRNNQKTTKPSRSHISIEYEMPDQNPQAQTSSSCATTTKKECTCHCYENEGGRPRKKRVPTIFFGSRTHKQLKQVVKELKQSQYKDVKMTILASRDHMCINPAVNKKGSITEGCKNLLETNFCRFNAKVKRFHTQQDIRNVGLTEAWDVEDLVKVCSKKSVRACPYFLSRSLMTQSDIVFCPYNYFIDPIIRQIVGIELSNNIIIVDEAHNIEGSCRESTSFSITKTAFLTLRDEITKLLKYNQNMDEYTVLLNLANKFISLIDTYSDQLDQKDFNQSCKIWSGFNIIAQMVNINFGPKDYKAILEHFKHLCADVEKRKEKGHHQSLTSSSLSMLEQVFIIMGFFYVDDLKNAEDFRMAIVKSVTTVQAPESSKRRRSARLPIPVQELTVHLWCMNPGVAFGDFHGTHSVILTSGTLSPMISFQSELQMPFQINMEGRHVIAPSQVWVGTIGSGPSGKQLKATYKFTETYQFQDELGSLVLDVCLKVPNGVLCFLSSYTFLDKLTKRWQSTGVWGKMLKRKTVITEPRSGNKEAFEKIWRQFLLHADAQFPSEDESKFDDSPKKEVDNEEGEAEIKEEKDLRDGALFLAVCRGKLSEGTDFANNSARAVITVGIPYPYVNDVQIGLKKEYNELHKATRHLLSGSEWFEIQAYRALNQALGRCIRHKDDWGAIILVDDRFLHGERYLKGLSKWVRNFLKPQYNYYAAMKSLEQFARNKNNCVNSSDSVSEQSTLDTTITKNSSEHSVTKMTIKNVNILKNLCSDTPEPSTSHIEPLITSTPFNEPLITSTPFNEPLITSTPFNKPIITSTPLNESVITSTPFNKNECSNIMNSQKSLDFLPVTINGISVIPKTVESFSDQTNQSECSTVFPIDSKFDDMSGTPRFLKMGNDFREKLNFEKDRLDSRTSKATNRSSESTVEPDEVMEVELELTNTQLVDETLKSEVLSSGMNLLPKPESDCEKAADPELNDKADSNQLHKNGSQSSPGLFSNSDSDILSIDESYLDELSKTVVEVAPSTKPGQISSDGDNDLLSYIENEKGCTPSKPQCSTSADTLDDDPELLSFVESKTENLSAFTADGSRSVAELPDVDMNDEDLLSFVENEESKEEHQKRSQPDEEENTSNPDTKQMLSRRPLFKTSFKPSSSLVNQVPNCNVRTAPKKSGCEDVFFTEEEEDDLCNLKTKRFTNRKKRHCAGDFNMPRKKVKGVVFEPPDEENSEVTCQTCQETLLTVHQIIERRPKVPPFLMNVFTKNSHSKEMLFLNPHKSFCEGLDDLMPATSHNGVLLNSAWFPDLDCCVQYLHCPKCQANRPGSSLPPIIGAKVVIGTKEYTTGQVWLSESAVGISYPPQ